MSDRFELSLPHLEKLRHGEFLPKAPVIDGFILIGFPGVKPNEQLRVERFELAGEDVLTVARTNGEPFDFKMCMTDPATNRVEAGPVLGRPDEMLRTSQLSREVWILDGFEGSTADPYYVERALAFVVNRSLREARKQDKL